MTKREAAIVSAYTRYLIGEFSDFQAYAEEIMGRPIFTHELPSIADELNEKSKKDFMSIKIEEEAPECVYHSPYERASWVDFDAVEKALGFRLFGYQKSYILGQGFRQMGRTTAEILRMLFDKEQYDNPIDFSGPARNYQKLIFRQQFREIWKKLNDTGIEMRPVFWSIEDKKKWQMVPDCNDCGYLNYTEKQQQAYGAKSYKKDHRCNCYNRPVYHRANSQKHDPYIYPCDECKEDSFVNYFDCENSKCNKKGE